MNALNGRSDNKDINIINGKGRDSKTKEEGPWMHSSL